MPQLSAVSLKLEKTRMKGSTSAYTRQLGVRTERSIHYFGERQTILETPAGAACWAGAVARCQCRSLQGLPNVIERRFTIFVIVRHDALA